MTLFLTSVALGRRHIPVLKDMLPSLGRGLSEYCLANLLLFRKVHAYALIYDNDRLLGVRGRTYDGQTAFMPLFDPSCMSTADLTGLFNRIPECSCFFPMDEQYLVCFDRDRFQIGQNPDDADYIYSATTLQTYSGRKLSKKRNLMKQFLDAHQPASFAYEPKRQRDAGIILDQWQREKGKPVEATDYGPAKEALKLAGELEMFGTVYYADGDPAGFLLASETAPGMCAIHFAKGLRRYQGIFPYMFHHFANSQGDGFAFYNFEQDLGNPSFRQTKRSFAPDRLLAKYRISPIMS